MKSLLVLALTILTAASAFAADDNESKIARAYSRVMGLTARPSDIAELKAKTISNGKLDEQKLFQFLFTQPAFIDNRLATFASKMSNEEGEPFETLDDFQAALILGIYKNIDFRDLLSK